ncbi:C6 transcription factor [Pochonia chlamydosporia 170]|uniref:C6 transcription factor n=1 Tax=Pochonia chlamydosporia 170 TaxID=1380566 RepID=A0A179G994_METCM|nr:C6 transcription factor [Pochonia chlamydosporia 170]OAQ73953.1 C6 transcription factor [Pochonia chlamydosporia 170]
MLRSASRWVLGKGLPSLDNEEKGFPPVDHHHQTFDPAANASRPLTIITTDESALVPPRDKLLVFRSLTGIDTVPTVSNAGHATRAAPNLGIYPRVVKAEAKASRSFNVYNIIVNFCLGTQIIVAAALTALGAANGSRVAVTAFGAINTIIAGFLTYLKGSGMPQRLKYIQDEFKAVREFIEQREREFCLADCALDPIVEASIINEMYQDAKQNLEGNNKTPGGKQGGRREHGKESSTISSMLGQRLSKLSESTGSTRVPGPGSGSEKM